MALQIRAGQVLEIDGRLLSVVKSFHSVGAGRQLGNVQVGTNFHEVKCSRRFWYRGPQVANEPLLICDFAFGL